MPTIAFWLVLSPVYMFTQYLEGEYGGDKFVCGGLCDTINMIKIGTRIRFALDIGKAQCNSWAVHKKYEDIV